MTPKHQEYRSRKAEQAAKYKSKFFERWFSWWRSPPDRFAALIAIFTAGLFLATFGLWDATKDLVHDAQSSSRAWVAPTSVSLNPNANEPLKAKVLLLNVGKEPAKDVKHWAGVGFIRNVSKPPNAWNDIDRWQDNSFSGKEICKRITHVGTAVIYPSATFGMSFDVSPDKDHPVPAQILSDEVVNKKTVYFVIGCISYETVRETRHTSFCSYLAPDNGADLTTWAFSSCPRGNEDY